MLSLLLILIVLISIFCHEIKAGCPFSDKFNGRFPSIQPNVYANSASLDITRASSATDYAAALSLLDWAAVVTDIKALLTNSQSFWPADFGNYGNALP